MKTRCHQDAIELAKGDADDITEFETPGLSQLKIPTLAEKNSRDAYHKMMVTAYELALHPTVSLNTFQMFINVQRKNGLKFISGMYFFPFIAFEKKKRKHIHPLK